MTANILALSYLFPNSAQPGYGVFVLSRLAAVGRYCNIKVVAPVQWYPLLQRVRRDLRGKSILEKDQIQNLEVFHPSFFVVPRYLKWIDAITYWWSVRSVVTSLASRGFEADLIDVHWTYPDIVAAHRLAARTGKKYMVTIRGFEALYLEENTIRRWLVAHYLRKADFVVTLSDELREKVIELGVDSSKIKVILNGVDQVKFHPKDRTSARGRLGLPLDRKIIVSVGRFSKSKGHQVLIKAMSQLVRKDADLYLIGGFNPADDYRPELRHLIAELHLDNVHLIDGVAHGALQDWYCSANVFSLATEREGCPNVVLEALACGTPAVVSDVGAVGEMVRSGENGFLISESSSWSSNLDAALAREWSQEDVAATIAPWTWDRCAEQVRGIYRSLLGSAA